MFKKFNSISQFNLLLMGALMVVMAAFAAPSPAAGAGQAELTLNFTGLEDLGSGWVYEGWIIVDGAPVSTGVFTVDANGAPSATSFSLSESDVAKAAAFVLTIEPAPDSDPAPSAVHVLGGDVVDGVAQLSVDHGAALGTDFADAAGSYILAAPSGGESAAYANGIWWLDPAGGPAPALTLPTLPAGWVYEGWVAGPDGPISTGRFSEVSGADSDGAGPAAGSEAAPPFPGQDFLNPAVDLTGGYAAVISVEPEPDNSLNPFTFKPLVDKSIDDVGGGTLQEMGLNPESLSSGVATLTGEAPATLPDTGADNSRPVLPLTLVAAGLLVLGSAVALRPYYKAQ